MRPSILFRQQSIDPKNNGAPKVKITPKSIPFYASKRNVIVNTIITSLYGYGLYAFYKDYAITKLSALHKGKTSNAQLPGNYEGMVEEVHHSPNRVFHSEDEDKELDRSTRRRVFHSLTYSDVSQFSIAWGFLIQLCNVTHATYGTRSMLYKTSLLSVLGFPPLVYYFYKLRLFKMEEKGVIIN